MAVTQDSANRVKRLKKISGRQLWSQTRNKQVLEQGDCRLQRAIPGKMDRLSSIYHVERLGEGRKVKGSLNIGEILNNKLKIKQVENIKQ